MLAKPGLELHQLPHVPPPEGQGFPGFTTDPLPLQYSIPSQKTPLLMAEPVVPEGRKQLSADSLQELLQKAFPEQGSLAPVQLPAPLQVSVCVQKSPSLQETLESG